jgi:hypothetical protein
VLDHRLGQELDHQQGLVLVWCRRLEQMLGLELGQVLDHRLGQELDHRLVLVLNPSLVLELEWLDRRDHRKWKSRRSSRIVLQKRR